MKALEKKQAKQLRSEGYSINEIRKKLNVSKSSVSVWVRDIILSPEQTNNLTKKCHTSIVIEKRRLSRLRNEEKKRSLAINDAKKDIKKISKLNLFLIGISLYWGEGAKKKHVLQFTNCDPKLIQIMMRFFKEIYEVPEEKIKAHVHLHPHLNTEVAESYWSEISGISRKQFYKTSKQHNKASKNKKDSLPYGTFSIYVCDVKRALKMKGWMEGLYEKIIEAPS